MSCQANIPDFISTDCPYLSGRVVAIAFIHKGPAFDAIYADPSNESVWVDVNYSSDLHVFQEVRGSYSGGQPTEVNGTGNQSTRVINAEHTLTTFIEGVRGNEKFWNEIVKSNDYRVAFVIGQDYSELLITDKDCSVFGNLPVEEGLDTEVGWNVVTKWRDINNPKTSAVPANVFN